MPKQPSSAGGPVTTVSPSSGSLTSKKPGTGSTPLNRARTVSECCPRQQRQHRSDDQYERTHHAGPLPISAIRRLPHTPSCRMLPTRIITANSDLAARVRAALGSARLRTNGPSCADRRPADRTWTGPPQRLAGAGTPHGRTCAGGRSAAVGGSPREIGVRSCCRMAGVWSAGSAGWQNAW